jgi:hypothetical protein
MVTTPNHPSAAIFPDLPYERSQNGAKSHDEGTRRMLRRTGKILSIGLIFERLLADSALESPPLVSVVRSKYGEAIADSFNVK